MTRRLQVVVSGELHLRLSKAAQRGRTSKAAWVRRALEQALRRPSGSPGRSRDPLARLASLEGPTGDTEQMIAEIQAGRA